MNIKVEPATPWNVTLAVLQACEERVGESERTSMIARWEFGRELVKRRVEGKSGPNKGKRILPVALKKLAMKQCCVSKSELEKRMRFADRYPTKIEARNAITYYGSWYRMTQEGLVEKKRTKKATAKPAVMHSQAFTFKRLQQEVHKMAQRHVSLSRDEVQLLDALLVSVQALLKQIDLNDQAKAEPRKVQAVS